MNISGRASLVGEGALADLAGVGPRARVDAHVDVEVVLGGDLGPAHDTGLLFCHVVIFNGSNLLFQNSNQTRSNCGNVCYLML